jgi:hypothetical protein
VHLHEVDYSLLRSKITKHTEIQEVARLMAGADCHAAFDHMCADLGTWHHAGWGPFLVLIAAFRTVMAYETNRPYELWYTKIDEFPTKTLKEYATGLRDVAGHPGLDQEFAQELEDLGKAIDAYVTTNVAARAKAPAASGQQS